MGADGRSKRRPVRPVGRRNAVRCLASVAVLVASCTVGVGVLAAPTAAAVGNSTLDALIVAPSSPGWKTAPVSEVAAIVARITKLDDDAVSSVGGSVQVAGQLWTDPASRALLAVTLVRWPANVGNLSQLVATSARQECVEVGGDNPAAGHSVPGVPSSVTESCTGTRASASISGTIAAAHRGNVSELVETYSLGPTGVPMPASQLDALAATQYRRLPAVPSNVSTLVGTAVAVAAAVSLLAVVVRRSRRRGRTVPAAPGGLGPVPWPAASANGFPPPSAAYPPPTAQPVSQVSAQPVSQVPAEQTARPGPATGQALAALGGAPGWHPVDGDPHRLHFWDGTRWTSPVRWDGAAWREDGSTGPT